jgi:surface antigen
MTPGWMFFWYTCGLFSCSQESQMVTEAQCRELAKSEAVLTQGNGTPVYAVACLSPDGKWWPGRIGTSTLVK